MKCLSIRQPYAAFVCSGVKTVENRSWKTDFRGTILIHASGDSFAWPDANFLPDSYISKMEPWIGNDDLSDLPSELYSYHALVKKCFDFYGKPFDKFDDLSWLKEATKEKGFALPAMSIIGEVELVDVQEVCYNDFADDSKYHWIFRNPIYYDNPVTNVVGRLRLWDYEV